jgi:hypothetical protein
MDKTMKTIINRAAVTGYTREVTKKLCPHITQISPLFLDKVNEGTKLLIKDLVLKFKSKQKTLK